jgi:hypothetical protein
MKAHVQAVDEKRALYTELQGLREYCTSQWGGGTAVGGSGEGGGRQQGGSAANVYGSATQLAAFRTGAAFLTVEICQKALVLLRPTALTAERVRLAENIQA